jgi:hypothetical protein
LLKEFKKNYPEQDGSACPIRQTDMEKERRDWRHYFCWSVYRKNVRK